MTDAIITVRQPFASAIFLAGKNVENRSWPTNYRGRLWIHAATKLYPRHQIGPRSIALLRELSWRTAWAELPRGCILGSVTLVDVVEPGQARASKWAMSGNYHWVLDGPVLLDSPIPWTGRQALSLIDPASFLGASQRA